MKCEKCGSKTNAEDIFCGNCGHKLLNIPTSDLCPGCGEPYDSGSDFCGNCGYKLSAVPEKTESTSKKICPSCGTAWDYDADFCGECGTPLPRTRPSDASPTSADEKPVHVSIAEPSMPYKDTHTIPDSPASAPAMKSTMREAKAATDPKKIADDQRGSSFFSKPEALD